VNRWRLGPRNQEEGLILDLKTGHALHDRVRGVGNRVAHIGLEREVRLPVLLRAADDRGEVFGFGPAQRIVEAHQPAPPPQIRIERRAIFHAHVTRVTLVDHHHVDVGELSR
jgi:hypothetical protein